MLDCQTRNSEGVFEKKEQFPNGRGGLWKWNSKGKGGGGVEHFGISEGKGGKISMPPVVWYGYFLESPNIITICSCTITIIIITTIIPNRTTPIRGRGAPYNRLYREALPKRGTFFSLEVKNSVAIS